MIIATDVQGDKALLALSGRFDFNTHKQFHEAYSPLFSRAGINAIEVDLQKVDYLDSAALGMLLVLKEQAGALRKTVTLAHCNELVARTLRVAKFDTLFKIV